MLTGGETVLVGLSGGPDSVCLLHVLHSLGPEFNLKLNAVYINHGLRPDETPRETEFCREICEALSIPFVTRAIDVRTYSKERGMNKQEVARELRYGVLEEIASETSAGRIALGHTADDQLETFLMRFFRGAGPKGLAGIPPVRGKIIRPLIETLRSEIEEFLGERKIEFIVDSSNLREDYTRNKIRLSIIPEMRKINPNIVETASRIMEIMREEEGYFDLIVTKTLMKLISRKTESRIELFLVPLISMEKVILRRILRRAIHETRGLRGFEFAHVEEIIGLIKTGQAGDRLYLPKGLRAIRNYSCLVLTSESPVRLRTYALPAPGEVIIEDIKAVMSSAVEEKGHVRGEDRNSALFDAEKTGTMLTVRARAEGDYFYPLGLGKKKKLQDFFVDEKVPRDERDSIPIVESADGIIWIAGHRGDERFKVTGGTKKFLRLEFKKKSV